MSFIKNVFVPIKFLLAHESRLVIVGDVFSEWDICIFFNVIDMEYQDD